MNFLKPNEQRAKTAITLIWIVMAVECLSAISGFMQYGLLMDVANGVEVSEDTANANDYREMAIGLIFLIVYIISAVTFIQWFRRAYYNLHQKVGDLKRTEGWAAGAWFVPIISLYWPYQIMKELFDRTKQLLNDKGIYQTETFSSGLVGWWWAVWIINNFVGQLDFRLSRHAETIDDITINTIVSIIGSLINIPLAIITVKLIKNYSAMEPLLNEVNDDDSNGNQKSTIIEGTPVV